MIIYRIRDWAKHFENHETRKLRSLSWVPIPNKLDGAGYRAIVAMPRAMEIFGAWVLILEVASRCPVRGTLEKDGVAFGPRELALKTGMPEQIYQVSLPALVSIGWLETCGESPGISRNLPESPGVPGETAAEGKGREGKGTEGKGTEEQITTSFDQPATAPVDPVTAFETVWKAYPRKIGKPKSAILATRLVKTGKVTWEQLAGVVERYAEAVAGKEPQYILHGPTFFGPNGRWHDYLNGHPEPVASASATDMHGERYTRPDGMNDDDWRIMQDRGGEPLPGWRERMASNAR